MRSDLGIKSISSVLIMLIQIIEKKRADTRILKNQQPLHKVQSELLWYQFAGSRRQDPQKQGGNKLQWLWVVPISSNAFEYHDVP